MSKDGFVRSSGEGWWSVEREAPRADDEEDGILDLDMLASPEFLAVCGIVIVAQILAVALLVYSNRRSPSENKKQHAKSS